jgi:hypothetical protein
MTELDQALEHYLQDDNQQTRYYDLVLNTDFYIPLANDENQEQLTPLIVETDGTSYLMLFDSEERLFSWARQSINYVVITGFGVAALSTPQLHWAVNIGGPFAKQFVPEEIGWLKESVRRPQA